jgi:simple sugar transport system permease protein
MASVTGARSGGIATAGERFRRVLLRPEPAAVVAFVLLTVIFSIGSPIFLTTDTFVSVMSVASELGIVAVGMTLLMIGGYFDLSVGAILGLSSWIVVTLMNSYGVPAPIAFVLALALAGCMGLVNGIILIKARINSFVVTLGTMLVYRGILVAVTGGFPVTVKIPPEVKTVVAGTILPFGFQMSLLWFLLIVAAVTVLLLRTRLGNWIQATGQNRAAARNLGVPVDRITLLLFVQCAVFAGVTGVIQVARFATVDAARGQGIELQAIAVSVIGGTLLTGGYGSAIGTALGAVVFAEIGIGLVLNRVPGYYYLIIQGAIVIAAVSMNTVVTMAIATARPLGGLRRGQGATGPPPASGTEMPASGTETVAARLRESEGLDSQESGDG